MSLLLEGYELIPYQDAGREDLQMILAWRNHPDVRAWMNSNDEISLQNHLNFASSLKDNPNRKYFMVKKNEIGMGCVYLDKKNEDFYWGYFLKPDYIASGKGVFLEFLALKLFFEHCSVNKLYAEVKTGNHLTKTLQNFFGFEKVSEELLVLTKENYKYLNYTISDFKKSFLKR